MLSGTNYQQDSNTGAPTNFLRKKFKISNYNILIEINSRMSEI